MTGIFSYSVILATYKEVDNLRILLKQLIDLLEEKKCLYELIVIDDASRDGTKEYIYKLRKERKIGDKIVFIERKNKKDLTSAIKEGTGVAKYKYIIRMDTDLSHRVVDLKKMLEYFERADNETILIGSRFIKDSRYFGKPIIKKIASLVGINLSRLVFNFEIYDLSNNFRVFPKKGWVEIVDKLKTNGNIMFIEELLLFRQIGYRFMEIPIVYKERIIGKSKLNVFKEFGNFVKGLPYLLFLSNTTLRKLVDVAGFDKAGLTKQGREGNTGHKPVVDPSRNV